MLCKTACLRKEKLLWYPHSGLGKYFIRIAINSVFWIESGIGCGKTVNEGGCGFWFIFLG